MNTKQVFHFSIILSGVDESTPGLEDALYQAGCDDALVHFNKSVVYLDFDREADTLENAVISAIQAIEQAGINAMAESVTPAPYVNISEIAKRLQLSRQSISLLVAGQRGDGSFPAPVFQIDNKSPLWRWSTVIQWFLAYNKVSHQESLLEDAICIENINAALEARNRGTYEQREQLYKRLTEKTML